MDCTKFLLAMLFGAAMGAGLVGCQRDSGEFRTVTEADTADRLVESDPAGGDDLPAATAEPRERLLSTPDPDGIAVESAPQNDVAMAPSGDEPIEPQLASDRDDRGDDDSERLIAIAGAADYPLEREVRPRDDGPGESGAPGADPDAQAAVIPPVGDPLTALPEDASPSPAVHREIKLLVPEKTFSAEGPEGALRISYDDLDLLKVLNMEPVPEDAVSHFPRWLSELDGERVRVRGFMYPTFQESGLTGFVLARDNQICCFGRNPKIYDLIEVSMRDGVTTNYIQGRPFDVVGVFHIRPDADEGELYQLYQIDDAIVVDR